VDKPESLRYPYVDEITSLVFEGQLAWREQEDNYNPKQGAGHSFEISGGAWRGGIDEIVRNWIRTKGYPIVVSDEDADKAAITLDKFRISIEKIEGD